MTTPEPSQSQRVNLREVWPNETLNFTPWLAKNLCQLGEAIGMKLTPVQEEAYGWAGYLDILAETTGGTKVAIENQLEASDSDHMARLLGYAINHDAGVLIWVAPYFHEYHQRILGGLKEAMLGKKEIYAVEIGVVGGSDFRPAEQEKPASGFRAVFHTMELRTNWPEAPSAEVDDDAIRMVTPDRFLMYYRPLVERLLAADIRVLPTIYGGFTGRWRSFATGHERIVYGLRIGTGGDDVNTAVFLEVRTENRQQIYDALRERQSEMQRELFGAALECYEFSEACGLAISTEASVDDPEDQQDETRDWMFRNLRNLISAAQPHLDAVVEKLQPYAHEPSP